MQTPPVVKYRAYDKATKKIAEVENIDFGTQMVKIAFPQEISGQPVHPLTYYRKWDEVVFLRFTGYKDKHGREIYDRDKVRGLVVLSAKIPPATVFLNESDQSFYINGWPMRPIKFKDCENLGSTLTMEDKL